MTEGDLKRRAKYKLAVTKHVEKVSSSLAATCRYYDTSRTAYNRWLRLYEKDPRRLEGPLRRPAQPTRGNES